jgi:hypothetical protein
MLASTTKQAERRKMGRVDGWMKDGSRGEESEQQTTIERPP